MPTNGSTVNRRQLLKSTGVAGVAGLTGLAGCSGGDGGDGGGDGGDGGDGGGDGGDDYPSLGNFPVEGDTVTFGFNVPQSGPYSSEGQDELRAYELAQKHLNNGGGWVDSFEDLSGDGVLGYTVDSVNGDTATDADTARQAASRMINRDDVVMISGGSSSAVAIAVQGLCQSQNVMFMACLTHSNDTTGKDCARYGFREMFNAYMTGQALAPVLESEYGSDNEFYQLYADYSWGQTQQDSMNQFLSEIGWEEVDSVPTPLGTSDFSSYLSEAANSGADVLVLNHYGLDGANSVSQAVDAGIDEDMELVVPLYNRPMAQAAGGSIEASTERSPGTPRSTTRRRTRSRRPSRTSTTASRPVRPSSPTPRRSSTRPPPNERARSTRRRSSANWRTTSTATSAWVRRRCVPATTRPSVTFRSHKGCRRASKATGTSSRLSRSRPETTSDTGAIPDRPRSVNSASTATNRQNPAGDRTPHDL